VLDSAGQLEHSPVPVVDLYVPASHAEHATPSDPAVCPATQMQSPTESLPAPELVPDGHVEHAPVPVEDLYVPAPHAVHSAPSEPAVYPATQMQSYTPSLPADELVPAGQLEHAPAPVTDLYLPASHAAHATPSDSAVCPAMQLQSPTPVLAKDELVPQGHAEHAPVPVSGLYVPTPHAVHSTPSDPAVYPPTQVQLVMYPLPSPELV
jgi:hypothetical protein